MLPSDGGCVFLVQKKLLIVVTLVAVIKFDNYIITYKFTVDMNVYLRIVERIAASLVSVSLCSRNQL